MEDRDVTGPRKLAVLEARRLEDDVVGLKFTWTTRGVDQRRPLLVEGSAHAVEIGRVVPRIEDLDLVAGAHEADAVVAPALAVSLHFLRRGELDVQLAVAEGLLGLREAAGDSLAVLDLPLVGALPGAHVLAVEEDDGIGRGGRVSRSGDLGGLLPDNTALVR